ncbi:hypothetical protein LJB86_02715 [Deltaproteobacteria bacterium OttesenSCG-928-M10]|nr:hypothetical protein [Deltaproteobacteria bacterium OttesenSCG-928-M10]
MGITVRVDEPGAFEFLVGVNRQLRQFPKAFRSGLVKGLNKTAVSTRAEAYRILNKRYFMKKEMKDRALQIEKASFQRLQTNVWGGYRPMTLGWWNAGMKSLKKRDRRGLLHDAVVVKILRSSGPKIVQRGFWRTLKKNPLVLGRGANTASGVEALYGPHPVAWLDKTDTTAYLEDKAHDILVKNFNHEAEYRLKKLGVL